MYRFVFCLILCIGCGTNTEAPIIGPSGPSAGDWLVPKNNVYDGGVGKDGIPSIDTPNFSPVHTVNPAFDNELVLGIEINGEMRAYPIPILDWHEIVNDNIGDVSFTITYCPLTGTGIGWSLPIGDGSDFGVSGLLFNSNLMPYDRRTNSTWSQQKLQCVNGVLVGRKPQIYTLVETEFRTWKRAFPESKIMNANTGFDRRYSIYPYGDYRTNQDRILFPVENIDPRLPSKERVLGVVINENAKVYRFNMADEGITTIEDRFEETNIIVAVSKDLNMIVAFIKPENREFEPVQDALPIILRDSSGNQYDLFGNSIDPSNDNNLSSPPSFMGFWFSWAPFYPDIEIYSD